MTKKKIALCVGLCLILVAVVISGYAYYVLEREDSNMKGQLFVFEGTSYYAIGDETNTDVRLIMVDGKNRIESCIDDSIEFELCDSENNEKQTGVAEITLLDEQRSYSLYEIDCVVESGKIDSGTYIYDYLKLREKSGKEIVGVSVGEIILEKVENINECPQVCIGYHINRTDICTYGITVDNNTSDNVTLETMEMPINVGLEKVQGKWSNNIVNSGVVEQEIECSLITDKNVLYLQPYIRYSVGGEMYCEIAKEATCYMDTVSKEDIIAYIEKKNE